MAAEERMKGGDSGRGGPVSGEGLPIEPLAYHRRMIDYLQTREEALWAWFSSDRLRAQQNEAARLDLLKCTYRIDRGSNEALYAAADVVSAKLGVTAPVTFYQSQNAGGLNVALAYMPGEAHVVLVGPIATTLSDLEVRAVLGHELAHFALLENWREFLTASQMLSAMASDVAAVGAHVASARLFGLYGEVYCDRGSYLACGDLGATITALAKIETGVTDVSADSYLRQTEEIFSKGPAVAGGTTHPETFIRARAIQLWSQQPEQAARELPGIIEGPLALESLDLLGQESLSDLTRRLIGQVLRPDWMQTEAMLAHGRLFFEDCRPAAGEDASLAGDLKSEDPRTSDYYCYVLLDFAVADRDLEEAPLAGSLLLSDALGLGERFRKVAAKELNLRKKQMAALESDAGKIVAAAAEAGRES